MLGDIPKPMVKIGYRPILWHVMKYYAHFGHKDFILCLGYRADVVKNYFLNYNECMSNDFMLSGGGKNLGLVNSDIDDWRITFADTGMSSNIGQRLKTVEKYLDGEDEFLANYSDGLTDLWLPQQLKHFHQQDKIASFLGCVRISAITWSRSTKGTAALCREFMPSTTARFESTAASSFSRKKSSTTCARKKNSLANLSSG